MNKLRQQSDEQNDKAMIIAYTSKIEIYVLEVLKKHCQHIDPVKLTNVLAKVVHDRHEEHMVKMKQQLEQIQAGQEPMCRGDSWIAQGDSDIPPAA